MDFFSIFYISSIIQYFSYNFAAYYVIHESKIQMFRFFISVQTSPASETNATCLQRHDRNIYHFEDGCSILRLKLQISHRNHESASRCSGACADFNSRNSSKNHTYSCPNTTSGDSSENHISSCSFTRSRND